MANRTVGYFNINRGLYSNPLLSVAVLVMILAGTIVTKTTTESQSECNDDSLSPHCGNTSTVNDPAYPIAQMGHTSQHASMEFCTVSLSDRMDRYHCDF